MVQLKKRAAVLVCAAAMAGFAGSAWAKPVHRSASRANAAVGTSDARSPDGQPYPFANVQAAEARDRKAGAKTQAKIQTMAQGMIQAKTQAKASQTFAHEHDAYAGFTSNSLVNEARKYLGTNPTGRGSLWCGAFMDLVLKHTGHTGGGNLARAYASYGTRVSGPQVGAIAVLGRRGGGHVGVVSGIDPNGNPIIVSGNHNHTVAESVYPASRVLAYVLPGG